MDQVHDPLDSPGGLIKSGQLFREPTRHQPGRRDSSLTSTNKDPILVVVQLTGGNDYMNTVVPYQDPVYYDNRKTVGVAQEDVLPISDDLAFNPALNAVKTMYDEGKVAVINGIGYPGPNRSHFRSMDI